MITIFYIIETILIYFYSLGFSLNARPHKQQRFNHHRVEIKVVVVVVVDFNFSCSRWRERKPSMRSPLLQVIMISKSLKQKSRVLNDVLQNVQERFGYLENDPVLKAAAVLDPDI